MSQHEQRINAAAKALDDYVGDQASVDLTAGFKKILREFWPEQQPEATKTDKLIVLLTRAQPYVSRSSPIYDAITEAIGRESQTPTTSETPYGPVIRLAQRLVDVYYRPVGDATKSEYAELFAELRDALDRLRSTPQQTTTQEKCGHMLLGLACGEPTDASFHDSASDDYLHPYVPPAAPQSQQTICARCDHSLYFHHEPDEDNQTRFCTIETCMCLQFREDESSRLGDEGTHDNLRVGSMHPRAGAPLSANQLPSTGGQSATPCDRGASIDSPSDVQRQPETPTYGVETCSVCHAVERLSPTKARYDHTPEQAEAGTCDCDCHMFLWPHDDGPEATTDHEQRTNEGGVMYWKKFFLRWFAIYFTHEPVHRAMIEADPIFVDGGGCSIAVRNERGNWEITGGTYQRLTGVSPNFLPGTSEENKRFVRLLIGPAVDVKVLREAEYELDREQLQAIIDNER